MSELFERCSSCAGVLGSIHFPDGRGGHVHRRCRRRHKVGSPTARLNRMQMELAQLEVDIFEQAHGSQDGYLLKIAEKIREIRT